ncbi:MAG: type II toxin-antitoxin system Phd/YefM family antitoxin [Candidatus Aerophobetes bacterium]|nr:type II toxin-antitoxin system Phd/YefM family antitoxin [Candidatus Aerophobetes bacterium]
MIEVISITEARNSFLSIIKSVKENFKRYILTKHGRPEVIILNYQEYCRMRETLDLISNKKALDDFLSGIREIKNRQNKK